MGESLSRSDATESLQGSQLLVEFLRGDEIPKIARKNGLSQSDTKRLIKKALDSMRPHEDYALYRARQLTEMEIIRTTLLSEFAASVGDARAMTSLVNSVAKVWDREAKLLNLDVAPEPVGLAALSNAELIELVNNSGAEIEPLDIDSASPDWYVEDNSDFDDVDDDVDDDWITPVSDDVIEVDVVGLGKASGVDYNPKPK